MAARMGAITGKGLSDLIREEFGFRVTFFMMVALVVTNFGNVVAEKDAAENEKFTKEKLGPRMDSYPLLVTHIAYPETGAIQRRLDDGKASPGSKPGNMYRYLGGNDQERQKNLALFKAWLGEGGWNLNRWDARGDVPAVSKEQLDKLKLAY